MKWKGVIEEYRSYLPSLDGVPSLTLLEGNTPLIPVPQFVQAIGGKFQLYLKYEAANPTGSFKDRGMVVAVAMAKHRGAQAVICASTGNTSASAAAYAARAGLKAFVLLPANKIALGKLAQAIIYGAKIVPVDGNFDVALQMVRELENHQGIEIVNSINPFRIEGQKTASFEICDVLDTAPDYHFLPVGNAGNITAYWKGYKEYHQAKKITKLPRMFGWQAAGSAPIVDGHMISDPHTIATAIRIGNPASWQSAVQAAQQSNGKIDKVTDEEILHARQLLAQTEGVFVEPACAAPLAGLMKMQAAIPASAIVTATMTGHGLKDPDSAIQSLPQLPATVEPKIESIVRAMGL